MKNQLIFTLLFVASLLAAAAPIGASSNEVSAVGDAGMMRDGLRVAFEAWNFCNEVGTEAPRMGSPRAADCFDVVSNGRGRGVPSTGRRIRSSPPDIHKGN
ncbi:hypothetical protein Droror1_Dr00018275 [Drosera rotundifolia]